MKNILITGSHGMIGKELVELLKAKDIYLFTADLKLGNDLRDFRECLRICNGMDEVYHLVGIKGNPRKTEKEPVDFMGPMLQFDTNMILAAQICGVKKFLYTSSIAVLNPETDKYPAWAKQTAENLIEAMQIQYPEGTQYCIVRPANVYGRYDNFIKKDLMVISDLIKKSLKKHLIEVWGDGSQTRDFINAKDVACAMKLVMDRMPKNPINIGSGKSYSIKEIAEIISEYTKKKIIYVPTQFSGSKNRSMDITELKKLGFECYVGIREGIQEVIEFKK